MHFSIYITYFFKESHHKNKTLKILYLVSLHNTPLVLRLVLRYNFLEKINFFFQNINPIIKFFDIKMSFFYLLLIKEL